MKDIVIYEVRFFSLIKLFIREKRSLRVVLILAMPTISIISKIKIYFLSHLAIASITFHSIFIKDFLDEHGTSVQFSSLEEATRKSLEFANLELEVFTQTQILPESYIRNLLLILAKEYHDDIFDNIRKVRLFHETFNSSNFELHLYVDSRLKQFIENQGFLGTVIHRAFPSFKSSFLNFAFYFPSIISLALGIAPRFTVGKQFYKSSIITLHEEEYHTRRYLRNILGWFLEMNDSTIRVLCIQSRQAKRKFYSTRSIDESNVIYSSRFFSGVHRLNICSTYTSSIALIFLQRFRTFGSCSFSGLHSTLLRLTASFLWGLESNYRLIKKVDAKLMVYEDIPREVHVFDTLAELGFVKTIKIQYSNLAIRTLFMQSNPSIFLVFSSHFSNKFQCEEFGVGPLEIVEVRKSSAIDKYELIDRSSLLKNTLYSAGSEFIIGYFDESVQEDSVWSYKTKTDHLLDIHLLCDFVINNSKVGVIFKTQFMKNNPMLLYPNDLLISRAIESKRFVIHELGIHRNLILPEEVALASDLCLGDLVGATASLEVALTGVPSIMVDCMNIGRGYREQYYRQPRLVYKNLQVALDDVTKILQGELDLKSIGDWRSVLSEMRINNDLQKKRVAEYIKELLIFQEIN
jgi:hypothetical protein